MTQQQERFNPNDHLMQIGSGKNAKDYLQVKWRMVWFRERCPKGSIRTEVVHLDIEKGIAIFKAIVEDGESGHAESHGSETARDFADYLEKAETKAIGRALAALGFGTQFAPELDEGERIADSPVERKPAPVTDASLPKQPTPPVKSIAETRKDRLNVLYNTCIRKGLIKSGKTSDETQRAFLAFIGGIIGATIANKDQITESRLAQAEKHINSYRAQAS